MKNYIGEYKGMGKSEIIDTYDSMTDTLIGRIAELQDEIDRLKVGQKVKNNSKLIIKKKAT